MYTLGRGVPRDYAEAATWFSKGADQGHAEAQTNLGVAYARGEGAPQDRGEGVPQDNVRAYMWFSPPKTSENLKIEAKDMTPAQIAEAQKLAREWKAKKN
jgi:TPR repeat protein